MLTTERFTYTKDTNTFSAEISDLDNEFDPESTLLLVSKKTNNISSWVVYKVERSNDEDNELQAWYLRPTVKTKLDLPGLKNATMIIFND
jgi:hypothetical protein